ncbi:MAG: hypothetical protein JST85_03745 [Acidobacteria bacterium]|nr:hypothetical protein [Acidobacteriota bacterium]
MSSRTGFSQFFLINNAFNKTSIKIDLSLEDFFTASHPFSRQRSLRQEEPSKVTQLGSQPEKDPGSRSDFARMKNYSK